MTDRTFSLGHGRKSVKATPRTVADAGELAEVVNACRGKDAWWSPHLWNSNRRATDNWISAAAIAIDVDYYGADGKHSPAPPDRAEIPIDAGKRFGVTACHSTPRGVRLIWVLREPATNSDAWGQAARQVCDQLDELLAGSGFRTDRAASLDLARIFWTPHATVDGTERTAPLQVVGDEVDLADLLPDPRAIGDADLAAAVVAYRTAHPLEVPRSGGTCPLCGHNGCFGQLPTAPHRWYCFSDRHEADSGGVGVRGARGWHGDTLDLHAHAQGCSRIEWLRRSSYLAATESGTPSVGSVTTPQGPFPVSEASANAAATPSVSSGGRERGPSPGFRPFQPLPDSLLVVPTFDPVLLPIPFRRWVEDIANRIQCPIDFPAVAAMVTYSAAIGRRVGIRPKQHDDWLVVPNLWGGPVRRPGVMKTPGLQDAMSFLRRIEASARDDYEKRELEHRAQVLVAKARERTIQKQIETAIKNGEDPLEIAHQAIAEEPVSPVRTRYVTNDATIEKLGELLRDNPSGILIFRDELTGLLRTLDKEGHEGARAFYLEAWNGTGAFTFDRIGRGTVEIPAAICSILGGIQPGPLTSYLKAAMRSGAGDDGLMQRFQLQVYPDVGREWKNVDQLPETAARRHAWGVYAAAAQLDALGRGACREDDGIPFLRFAPEGQEAFDHWRASLEMLVRSGNEVPAIEAHLSKYRSLVPSLALLTHIAEGVIGPVSRQAVETAIAWTKYLEPHARRIYGLATGNHLECRAIAKHILNGDLQDGFDARRVYRSGWADLGDPSAVECGLEELIQRGWLAEETQRTAGRSALVYRINPQIWERGPGGTDRTDRRPPDTRVKRESAPRDTDRTDRSAPTPNPTHGTELERGPEPTDKTDRSQAAGSAAGEGDTDG